MVGRSFQEVAGRMMMMLAIICLILVPRHDGEHHIIAAFVVNNEDKAIPSSSSSFSSSYHDPTSLIRIPQNKMLENDDIQRSDRRGDRLLSVDTSGRHEELPATLRTEPPAKAIMPSAAPSQSPTMTTTTATMPSQAPTQKPSNKPTDGGGKGGGDKNEEEKISGGSGGGVPATSPLAMTTSPSSAADNVTESSNKENRKEESSDLFGAGKWALAVILSGVGIVMILLGVICVLCFRMQHEYRLNKKRSVGPTSRTDHSSDAPAAFVKVQKGADNDAVASVVSDVSNMSTVYSYIRGLNGNLPYNGSSDGDFEVKSNNTDDNREASETKEVKHENEEDAENPRDIAATKSNEDRTTRHSYYDDDSYLKSLDSSALENQYTGEDTTNGSSMEPFSVLAV